ncbi:ATP-dependent DNA helicase PIF1 [Holothuria leucospilota]|uniref:ATP-dependent DNA helicase n=1 Tax=Holothuria leucospilota TaxID=206669 RepID=A0A9Q1B9E4_HOLLE|nr:ATP-dependent DNA helicase PIF1 [Holothuria leucospilota]
MDVEEAIFESGILNACTNIPELSSTNSSTTSVLSHGNHLPRENPVDHDTITSAQKQSMNEKQRKLFRYVSHWSYMKMLDHETLPFNIFLTGGAGTGKSLLANCIKHEVEQIFRTTLPSADCVTVLLLTFTGTAAFNIHGQTIHSALAIQNTKLPYVPLGQDTLNTLRMKHEHLKLIVIDKISMVDINMLCYISCRLQQRKASPANQPFGYISVLIVGDFFQLPPVRGKPLFDADPGSLVNLWSLFKKWELDDIMRQKNDTEFAHLLNRIRILRKCDNIACADEFTLQERLTSRQETYPENALHIYSRNIDVTNHNNYMLHEYCHNIQTIYVVDVQYDSKGQKRKRKEPITSHDSYLLVKLEIAVGAKVMLTTNLHVSDGLVNGVCGIIEYIQTTESSTLVTVNFEDNSVGKKRKLLQPVTSDLTHHSLTGVVIKPHAETFVYRSKIITRQQFPLKLA